MEFCFVTLLSGIGLIDFLVLVLTIFELVSVSKMKRNNLQQMN